MTGPIESAIAQCNVPGSDLEPLLRLWMNDYKLSDDEYEMIRAGLRLNHGRPPSEKTEENRHYLARFLLAYRSQKRIEGHGGMLRALRIIIPQFPDILNDPENPHSLARRIIGGKRPDITKLANSLGNESKALGNDTSGRIR